jgi:hypothetical protein
MIFTNAYIVAWVVFCATLTDDDITTFCDLTTEDLHTKSFTF